MKIQETTEQKKKIKKETIEELKEEKPEEPKVTEEPNKLEKPEVQTKRKSG